MSGTTLTLRGGQEVYIKHWPASVSLENLTKAGKYLGPDHIINICHKGAPAAIVAILDSDDAAQCAALVKHFVCTARMDGSKIEPSDFDDRFRGELALVNEVFAAVVRAQYFDFFESGLAKGNSQDS